MSKHDKNKNVSKTQSLEPYDLYSALSKLNSKQPNIRACRSVSSSEPITNNIGNINLTVINNGNDDSSDTYNPQPTVTEDYINSRIDIIDAKYTKSLAEFQKEVNRDINDIRKSVSNNLSNGAFWAITGIIVTILIAVFSFLFNKSEKTKNELFDTRTTQKDIENRIELIETHVDSLDSKISRESHIKTARNANNKKLNNKEQYYNTKKGSGDRYSTQYVID